MNVTTQTTGFKELQAAFKMMPPEIQNKVLGGGVLAAAKVVQRGYISAAPRGGIDNRSITSFLYGRLFTNLKARGLRKRQASSRAAVVTRGKAFWGDFLNRGTRYIPATHWADNSLRLSGPVALQTMKEYMVKRIKSISEKALRQTGAAKR